MEGEGEPPEALLVFEQRLEEEDLLEHVQPLGQMVLLPRLGPPLRVFQIGSSVVASPFFVRYVGQFPPEVNGHPGHLHGFEDEEHQEYRQQSIGEQNQG
jgi:hypothetical protein